MSGAIAATLGGVTPSNGSATGAAVAGALAWNDIYGEDSGSTQALTVTGLAGPMQIVAARTGSGLLSYILNGAYAGYTGAFTVNTNDLLAWAISVTGAADRSGVVTVSDASTSAVLDSFNYSVYSSQGGRM